MSTTDAKDLQPPLNSELEGRNEKALTAGSTHESQPISVRPLESSLNGAEKSSPPGEGLSEPPRKIRGFLWAVVVSAILSSTFLFSLDNTIVADIQPAIVREFGSVDKLTWLSVGYLLGSTVSNLFWGQVYSQFDGKWVYILCVLTFEVGSAVCGAAPSISALIVSRVVCGLGGAGMYAGVMVLLSANTNEKERPTYFGLTGLTWGAGTSLGPIIGGAFADSTATWRWGFYINLVVGGVCAPIYLFLLPRAEPFQGKAFQARIKGIDVVGSILICGFFSSGLMAISFGGTLYDWNSGQIIGLFVCFGVLFLAFAAQQYFLIGTTKESQLLPLEIFTNPFMINLYLQCAGTVTANFVPIYFIPLYFSFVQGDPALESGVRLLPYIVPMVVFCVGSGYAMSYFGYYAPFYIFGASFALIGSALLYTIDASTSNARIYAYSALAGLGSGTYIMISFSVAQVKAPKHLVVYLVGILTNAQQCGPGFALSIANAAFLNSATKSLAQLLPQVSKENIQLLISGAGTSTFKQLTPSVQRQAILLIVAALTKSFAVSMSAGALTLLLALPMKWEKFYERPSTVK